MSKTKDHPIAAVKNAAVIGLSGNASLGARMMMILIRSARLNHLEKKHDRLMRKQRAAAFQLQFDMVVAQDKILRKK